MKRIIYYLNERFPIFGALLFAVGYVLLALGTISTTDLWYLDFPKTFLLLFALVVNFFSFLLRTRVIDEFKDSEHDLKNFPDRPYVSGKVLTKELVALGIVAFGLEISAVAVLGIKFLVYYLPLLIYSFLMAKEFFISKWLTRHFNIYFLSHEFIFLFFGIFYFFVITAKFEIVNNLILCSLVLLFAPMIVELVRKFSRRYSANNKEVKDTYSGVWGRNTTLLLMIILTVAISVILAIVKNSIVFVYMASFAVVVLIYSVKTADKIVKTVGSLIFLILAVISNML